MPAPFEIKLPVDAAGRLTRSRHQEEQIKMYLSFFTGKEVTLRIGAPKRSTKANAFYWSQIIAPLRQAMGLVGLAPVTADALHEWLKARHLDPVIEEVMGEETHRYTTKTDSFVFSEYLEKIKADEEVLRVMTAAGMWFADPEEAIRGNRIMEAT